NPYLPIRKAQLHRRLSYAPAILLPLLWLLMLPEALLRAVIMLLNKQPQRFFPEIAAALSKMFAFASIGSSRKRFRRNKTHSYRELDPLRQSTAESRRLAAQNRDQHRSINGADQGSVQYWFGG